MHKNTPVRTMAVQAGVLCGQGDTAVALVLFCQSLLSLFLGDEIGHALELMPMVERLCSMAEDAGCRMPIAPSAMRQS